MAQVLLTGEPALVASACSLLQKALHHNAEALPRLYQTGLYFFALAYCGSNLLEVATLFQVCLCSSFTAPTCCGKQPKRSGRTLSHTVHPPGVVAANHMLLIQTFVAKAAHALPAILLVDFPAHSFMHAVIHMLLLFVSLPPCVNRHDPSCPGECFCQHLRQLAAVVWAIAND